MKLFSVISLSVAVVMGSAIGAPAAKPVDAKANVKKPNIIFVLVDDMGWGDLDANWQKQNLNGRVAKRNHEFKTPALSAMAREGIQLRRHYTAAPVCAPARASLLLGVHQGASRVVRNNQFDRPIEDSHTLGTVMKAAGYDTVAIGKWGVGGGGESKVPMTAGPHQRGFDYFYGILDHLTGHYHYPSECRNLFEYDGEWKNIKDIVPKTAYSTDLFGAKAKQWIVEQRKSAQKTGKPFFMYLALPAPHASLAVPAVPYPAGGGLKGGLQWVKRDGVESVNTAFGPEAEKNKDTYIYPEHAKFDKKSARHHATMIRRVDDLMADLIKLLKDLKVDDNTMIVFTSDNGPHNEPGSDPAHQHGAQDPQYFTSYGMMDGIKRDCREGGLRVPTLVRWPARVPKGRISFHPGQFHDWMATLADAAGIAPPARSNGVSLLPTLTGNAKAQKPGVIYVEYNFPGGKSMKYGDFLPEHRHEARGQQQVVYVDGYKGLRNGMKNADDDFMIYDTLKDPQESKNLASQMPQLQAKMKAAALSNRRACYPAKNVLDTAPVPSVQPQGQTVAGLNLTVYEGDFPWVPDFEQLAKPAEPGKVAVNSPADVKVTSGAAQVTGYLNVPADGAYTFYLVADGKAFVRLHEMELLDADKGYVPGTEVSSDLGQEKNPVYLKAGLHPISIGLLGKGGIKLMWEGPGIEKQVVPPAAFKR